MASCCVLYLARHGQTTANRDGILQGTSDYPLTDKGVEEAGRGGRAMRLIQWSKIMCSDLKRASRTCKLMLDESDSVSTDLPPIEESETLREVNFGVMEGRSKDITREKAVAARAAELGITVDEVEDPHESPEDILQRQMSFLSHLRGVSGNVLAVAHGAYIKNFLKNVVQFTDFIKITNCAVSMLHVEFVAGEDVPIVTVPHPEFINCSRHMEEEGFLFPSS